MTYDEWLNRVNAHLEDAINKHVEPDARVRQMYADGVIPVRAAFRIIKAVPDKRTRGA